MFIPNTVSLTPDSRLHIITGPNMAGKSTLLRQTALIAILAQCGSFVPADKAIMGIIDKLFSRVGAKDDLFRDRSTFMVEMLETADILNHATNRSLVSTITQLFCCIVMLRPGNYGRSGQRNDCEGWFSNSLCHGAPLV